MNFYLESDLFIKSLLFLLVFIISFTILKKIFNNKVHSTIISLVVSFLSVFYISYEQIDFLSKIYTPVGFFILMFVPFLIFFFFIYSLNVRPLLRKVFWILFFSIFLVLAQRTNINSQAVNIISISTLILGFFLILFDKTIKNKFLVSKNLRRIK